MAKDKHFGAPGISWPVASGGSVNLLHSGAPFFYERRNMMSLEAIRREAREVSDMANSQCQPDLAAAVIKLADLIVDLSEHVGNALANGTQPD